MGKRAEKIQNEVDRLCDGVRALRRFRLRIIGRWKGADNYYMYMHRTMATGMSRGRRWWLWCYSIIITVWSQADLLSRLQQFIGDIVITFEAIFSSMAKDIEMERECIHTFRPFSVQSPLQANANSLSLSLCSRSNRWQQSSIIPQLVYANEVTTEIKCLTSPQMKPSCHIMIKNTFLYSLLFLFFCLFVYKDF